MGGGRLAGTLLDAGMIDEVVVNVHPVLLGGGAPMFGASSRRSALHLSETQTLSGRCMLAAYRVNGHAAAQARQR